MISFQPTEDEEAFVEVSKRFAKETLRPIMREVEASKQIPDAVILTLRNLGFLQMEEPEEINGLALPLTTQVQIYSALAYGDLAMIQGLPGLNDGASFLRVIEHKLAESMDGVHHTIAYISATADQAFSTLQLKDNQLTGTSLPIRLAQIATHFLIAIKNEAEETILLLLPRDSNKQEVSGLSRLGLAAAHIGKVTFQDTGLKEADIVAVGEEAEAIIREAEIRIQLLHTAKLVGVMQAALDYTIEYTSTRKAFGQEIAKFQAVSFRIAKMAIELRATNHLMLEATNALDKQSENAHQKAWKVFSQAKQAVKFITDSAVQLLGGHGFVQDFPVEKWMRDAQAQLLLYKNADQYRLAYGMELLAADEKVVVG